VLRGPAVLGRPALLAALAVTGALAGCGSVTASGVSSAAPAAQASAGHSTGPQSTGSPSPSPSGAAASSTASAGTGQGQAALCAGISRIDRLVILRSRGMNRIQEVHFPFPLRVTVTNAAAAQSVARAVCALPRMPAGVFHCPDMLLGTTYQLTFTAGGQDLPVVTAQSTGCQTVTGAGPVRRADSTSGFWQVLGRAIGLYSPGVPVFRGDGPAASQCTAAETYQRLVSGCPGMAGFRK
jgi:hypothetical protein